jgi:hypothetical protein
MDERASADCFEASGEKCAHAIGCGLVVAGRFYFDKFANRLDDLILAGLEVSQALGPDGVCHEWFGTIFLGPSYFLSGHL